MSRKDAEGAIPEAPLLYVPLDTAKSMDEGREVAGIEKLYDSGEAVKLYRQRLGRKDAKQAASEKALLHVPRDTLGLLTSTCTLPGSRRLRPQGNWISILAGSRTSTR